jgi:hypothetical protein
MYGSQYWQVICEDLETRRCSIVGKNLSQMFAREIAEKLQKAVDADVSQSDDFRESPLS